MRIAATPNIQDLYTNLGYLFYSIAAIDGKVRALEAAALRSVMKEYWLPLEDSSDEFGTDMGYYIEIAFDEAVESKMDPDNAFALFKENYKLNRNYFQPSEREMIQRTAAAIAGAYANNNKAELTRLAQLTAVLRT
jgi:uncharacterized tellurite resistance protein B-like protein